LALAAGVAATLLGEAALAVFILALLDLLRALPTVLLLALAALLVQQALMGELEEIQPFLLLQQMAGVGAAKLIQTVFLALRAGAAAGIRLVVVVLVRQAKVITAV
jgi:hypothetical protein